MKTISVGIIGFRGYSGAELAGILEKHPHVEPVLLEHRDAEYRPQPIGHAGPRREKFSPEVVRDEGLAVVFLATPPEVSMELTPPLLAAGARGVERSGAFGRGTDENYRRWYKEPHTQAELLAEAVYGLPEFYRSQIPGARLVSKPRCYPTAGNLA